jgi:uncharacterized protein YlxW (UPF0749 family)
VTAIRARLGAIPSWQVTLGVALLALGFLIAAQLASEGPRIRYTTQERSPLIETVIGLQSQQETYKQRILQLRASIQAAEQQGQGSASLLRQLNDQLDQARLAAGLTPLTGTGFAFELTDSAQPIPPGANDADYLVTARDIRAIVEELWLAGAEAIAVNGERIATTTAIVDVGGSILVNSAYKAPPYQIVALGPADLYDRVAASQGFTDFIRARAQTYGIGVSILQPETVNIPAFAGTVGFTLGQVVESPAP